MRSVPLAEGLRKLVMRLVQVAGMLLCAALSLAQQAPALLVTPSTATMNVGETRTFRAVDAQGRLRTGITWSVTPSGTVSHKAGDEIEISAEKPGSVTVMAAAEGQTATAQVTVSAGPLPTGTSRWTLLPLPGNRFLKFTQAQPSSSGPDLYAIEQGSGGSVIRALSADGRELWRTALDGELKDPPPGTALTKPDARTAEAKAAARQSVCGELAVGMHWDVALARVRSRGLIPSFSKGNSQWEIEQPGVTCIVTFDPGNNRIVSKKKLFTAP